MFTRERRHLTDHDRGPRDELKVKMPKKKPSAPRRPPVAIVARVRPLGGNYEQPGNVGAVVGAGPGLLDPPILVTPDYTEVHGRRFHDLDDVLDEFATQQDLYDKKLFSRGREADIKFADLGVMPRVCYEVLENVFSDSEAKVPTSLNPSSSRSHLICTLKVECSSSKTASSCSRRHMIVVQFVDLAGREQLGEEHGFCNQLKCERNHITLLDQLL
eukprot:g17159.t1